MSTHKAHETDIGEFINTLETLKNNICGNCHYELRLYQHINALGKPLPDITVGELLNATVSAKADYNRFMERVWQDKVARQQDNGASRHHEAVKPATDK